jgi:catechol 2,3-dioxygenase-like lactoylglutathione lyase family enzyme
MLKRIDTIFLPVTNLDRSIEWYAETLGLKLRWISHNYACLNVDQTALTLVQQNEITAHKHEPFNFYVDDIKAMHAKLSAQGAAVSELRDHGDVVEFTVTDPDGNPLGIVWFDEK